MQNKKIKSFGGFHYSKLMAYLYVILALVLCQEYTHITNITDVLHNPGMIGGIFCLGLIWSLVLTNLGAAHKIKEKPKGAD